MIKKVVASVFTVITFALLLGGLPMSSTAQSQQVTTYEEVKRRTVDEYRNSPIEYGPTQHEAIDREDKQEQFYKNRVYALCAAVARWQSSRCGSANCSQQVLQESADAQRKFVADISNLTADRKDKISSYWDHSRPRPNRIDGRNGNTLVSEVKTPRKAFYPRLNYRGQIQIELNGRPTWVDRREVRNPQYDESAGRWYVIYRGRKVYAAGN